MQFVNEIIVTHLTHSAHEQMHDNKVHFSYIKHINQTLLCTIYIVGKFVYIISLIIDRNARCVLFLSLFY